MVNLKKGVVFDFDGVIINSCEIQRQAFLESYKIIVGEGNPSFAEFLSHSGDSLHNILLKMNLPLEMIEPYRRISRERIGLIKENKGIRELLERLTADGYICALCTGKERSRTLEIVEKLTLGQYFKTIVCSDDVKYPKPHRESLVLALNNMDIDFDNAVMVGDGRNDILCAKNTGVKCIAVGWGDTPEHILKSESPNYLVNTPDELYKGIITLLETNDDYDIAL